MFLDQFLLIVPPCCVAGMITLSPLNAGVVAYYDFDQSSGLALPEISGPNAFNGSLQPSGTGSYPQWRPGKFGNSLEFGSLKRVSFPLNTHLHSMSDSFAIAGWARRMDTSSLPLTGTVANIAGQGSIFLGFSSGNPYANISFYNSNTIVATSSTIVVDDYDWHHIAMTYSDGGQLTVYLDGQSVATANDPGGRPALGTNFAAGMTLGRAYATNTAGLNGRIDDLALWDQPVAGLDISLLWNEGDGSTVESIPEPGAVALTLVAAALVFRRRR